MKLSCLPIIVLLGLATACKTAKPTAQTATTPAADTYVAYNGSSAILAVTVKASRNTKDSNIVFSIESAQKVPGKLKTGQNDNTGDDYIISFATAEGKVISTYHVSDPLNTHVESTNEAGQLETVLVKKNEEYFPVRTNYIPGIKKLIIKKKNDPDSKQVILLLNIE